MMNLTPVIARRELHIGVPSGSVGLVLGLGRSPAFAASVADELGIASCQWLAADLLAPNGQVVGGIAEGGHYILDFTAVARSGMQLSQLDRLVWEVRGQLDSEAAGHGGARPNVAGMSVLAIDDGTLSPAAIEAGLVGMRRAHVGRIVFATRAARRGFRMLARRATDSFLPITVAASKRGGHS